MKLVNLITSAAYLLLVTTSVGQVAIGQVPTLRTLSEEQIPKGDTFVIQTTQGGVPVKNFYRTAVSIDSWGVLIKKPREQYYITYFHEAGFDKGSFLINPNSKPLQRTRIIAERDFLATLAISEADACKLQVSVKAPAWIAPDIAGVELGLSFCRNRKGNASRISTAQTESTASFSHLQPAHRLILNRWLASRPWLRIATEADARQLWKTRGMSDRQIDLDMREARDTWGAEWHPYYAVGDFNHDGRIDFAVGFIDRNKREKNLSYAVFNAPFTGKNPAFFREGFDFGGWLFYNPKVMKRDLLIGEYATDGGWLVVPRGNRYILQ